MCYRKYAVVLLLFGLSACSSPLLKYRTDRSAIVQTTLSQAAIVDARRDFRAVFCTLVSRELKDGDAQCEQWLTTLADEPRSDKGDDVALPGARHAFRLVFVAGIFGECLGDKTRLLGDGIARLREEGYETSYAPVRGRGSSSENARIIRDHVLKQAEGQPERKTIIVSYSKGTADVVTALADFPELSPHVSAVISLAGVINGSPLADYVSDSYSATIARLPYHRCPVVDKGEMTSISRAERQRWLSGHRLPRTISYFSIVGAPRPDRISTVLKPFYDRLAYVDPLNDGQVLFYDAVIPGSTLLAYVNADHWAIALPFETSDSALAHSLVDKNHFPRSQMLRAALALVEKDLAKVTSP